MSAAAVVFALTALVGGQAYRCPEDTPYDLVVKGNRVDIVAMTDTNRCLVKGTSAHCREYGNPALAGDISNFYAKITPDTVTLFAPNGTVCRSHL